MSIKNKFNKKGIYFFALGGAEEIGMNLFCYVVDGKIMIVDCGYMFLGDDYPGMDLSMADFSFLKKHKKDIVGIFITHAHEDHFGAIGYILPELDYPPVYATDFALGVIKERLKEFIKLEDATLITQEHIQKNSFDISYINLIHSVPETSALYIKTPYGNIFHATDWRFDDELTDIQKTDFPGIEKAKEQGVDIFVCDSTNVLINDVKLTESQVRKNLIDIIPRLKNTVVASCFASNLVRLESLILAAHAASRTPVLMGRSIITYMRVAKECGYFKDLPYYVLIDDAKDIAHENALYITTGSQANYRSGLVRIADGESKDIKLGKGDSVIFSSRMVEGNEDKVIALQEKFIKKGVEVISGDDLPIHTSGHGGKNDIKKMYELLKPKMIIPVHGEKKFIREHKKFATTLGIEEVISVNNGEVLLYDGKPKIVETLPTQILAVDRNRLIPLSSSVIKNRKQIAFNGSVFISFAVDSKWQPIDVKISSKDILEDEAFAELRDEIEKEVIEKLPQKIEELNQNEAKIVDFVRVFVRKRILKATEMKPVTFIHFYKL